MSSIVPHADNGPARRLAALEAVAAYARIDPDGRLADANDLFCRLLDRPAHAILGTPCLELTERSAAPDAVAAFERALAQAQEWRGELPFAAGIGQLCWIDATLTPDTDPSGTPATWSLVGIDITQRRSTDDALRQSAALLRSTLAALSEGIVVQDAGGRVLSCNPAAERILKSSNDELVSGTPSVRWRTIREDGSEFPATDYPSTVALKTGQPQDQVVMGLQGDHGPPIWISVNAQPVYSDGASSPTSVVTSLSDISARKLAQETLLEAVAAMPDGFVIFDADDRLVLCNEAYRELYKESAPAIRPGVSFRDLLLFGLDRGQYPEIGASEEHREAWIAERLRMHRSPGEPVIQRLPDGRWLQIRERRTPSGYVVGFRTDVTELKREIAKVRAIVDNFPGGISLLDHDLRLATFNQEFVRLLDLPGELFECGAPTLEMVFRANAARGEYGSGDVEAHIRARLDLAREAVAHVFERTRPDGTVLEIRGTPIQDGGFVTIYTDVTNRHAAQSRLAASEQQARAQSERLQAMLAHMGQGVSMFDGDGRLLVWNQRFLDLYGLAPDSIREGLDIVSILEQRRQLGSLDCDAETFAARIREHLARDPSWTSTSRTADGRVIQIRRTRAQGGGWLAIHEDITEKQRADTELRAQADELARINMRFEAALTHMSQGICLFDSSQRLVICNERFREMYHFAADQIGPGSTLETILRQLGRNGERSPLSVEQHLVSLPGRNEEVLRLIDGRSIAIRRRPTPDGGWVATHEDITERERADQKISHLAYHDALTGLANRAQFKKHGELALARAAETGGMISVLLVDLDRFKAVNDTFGHAAGDEVLRAATQRMRETARSGDVIARLGGDEFAIIQDVMPNQREAALSLAARLVDSVGAPYDVNGHQAMIGASIGIALQSGPSDTIELLMHRADLALYRVKAAGRNGYRFYEEDLASEEHDRLTLGNELRAALASGALEVRYQPIVALADLRVCGMEARVHWMHPGRGLLDGRTFAGIAEEIGLTVALGEFVLARACIDAGRWPEHVRLTVNVAASHIRKRTLMDTVTRALLKARMAPERLEIAVAETELLRHDDDILTELHQLRSLGISVVIDDYGAGNSSLNHLRVFPFDRIKIDAGMVTEITERPETAAIICAVTGLARSLDILTTAEGVEHDDQLRVLQAAGCSQAQGGMFGAPVNATEALSRLLIENALPEQRGIA